jgi:glutathionylspermidine synthase
VTDYAELAALLSASGVITDPWLDGAPRFSAEPVILSAEDAALLAKVGEETAVVYDECVQLALDDEAVAVDFYRLTPAQVAMFRAHAPLWHVLGRVDVFFTDEGPKITELNSDTPTGEPEAVVTSALARAARPELIDPNAALCARFLAACRALHGSVVGAATAPVVGLVYPTELTEDLSLIRLWRRVFEAAGMDVVLGSPFNLSRDDDGAVCLFDRPVSLVVRHYKTDWWGERESAWLDEDVRDPAPLVGPLRALVEAQLDGRCVVVNPFAAVLTQNKRAMAFCWERIHRFSVRAQGIIERILPYTARLEAMHEEQLRADRAGWVLKSDYGAEGDEVIVGADVDDDVWRRCLALARPGRWIAQRYFRATQDARGRVRNHGVFVVAGRASGLYTRVHGSITDVDALSVPTLVRPAGST